MIGTPRDRTGEVKTTGRLEIGRGDCCDAFEQDESRLFSSRECWYCRYGDFSILTEHPTQKGVCRLKINVSEKPNADLYQKTEDKGT